MRSDHCSVFEVHTVVPVMVFGYDTVQMASYSSFMEEADVVALVTSSQSIVRRIPEDLSSLFLCVSDRFVFAAERQFCAR